MIFWMKSKRISQKQQISFLVLVFHTVITLSFTQRSEEHCVWQRSKESPWWWLPLAPICGTETHPVPLARDALVMPWVRMIWLSVRSNNSVDPKTTNPSGGVHRQITFPKKARTSSFEINIFAGVNNLHNQQMHKLQSKLSMSLALSFPNNGVVAKGSDQGMAHPLFLFAPWNRSSWLFAWPKRRSPALLLVYRH